MGKYSRKVRTWGALPEFTEHKNKQGKVSSRTSYFEGKARTVRVPQYRTGNSGQNTRGGSSVGSFALGAGASSVLGIGIVLILLIAGIGWVFNLVAGALEGFWPILGSALGWTALAASIVTVPVLGIAVGKRILYDGASFGNIVSPIAQLLALFPMWFCSIVAVIGLDRFSGSTSILSSWVTVLAIALVLFTVVSSIVFGFMYGKGWFWLSPAAIVFSIVCAFFTPLGIAGAVLSAVVTLIRYNWRSLFI